MEAQRQLLAQLMSPLIPMKKKDFRDSDVCKLHLSGFCPSDIFTNTKVDVVKCNLIHNDSLQKEYQTLPDSDRIYDFKFYEYLTRLLNDVERAIKRGHSRLETKSDVVFDNLDDIREKILILEEQIQPRIGEICEYGEAGKVAEAADLFFHLSKLTTDLENARQNDPTHPTYRPDKRMEVCQVCGALLANDSTGGRIEAHMIGKQHTGFMRIRKTLEDYAKRAASRRDSAASHSATSTNPPSLPYANVGDRDHRDRDGYRDTHRGGDRRRYDDRDDRGYRGERGDYRGAGGGYRRR